MPSEYSPDLRIELIGTGDQAGVWGATTNNNLAYVLEQAIAGYVSVPVTSTSQVLTYVSGSSSTAADNQSVHASLALTASGVGADFFLYAPPSSKLYVIYNNTGYTAKVRNSYPNIGDAATNGTGVDIPTGKVMTVWTDGTNFVQQNTHLISPTVAGGTLTSPTLVTPALGTPSSGTLTNATGLPIDGGTTGTLPVLRGGTGVTTSTGSGSNVLSTSPTLVSPALGTPTALVGTNITGTASGLSIGGSAASATNATYATSAGSAGNATYAAGATNATYAGSAGSAGSATNATYAASAGAVAWGNVSSKPALVYNDSGTYSINIYGGAASATNASSATYAGQASFATYATSAGSATNSGYANSSTYASSAGYATSAGSAAASGFNAIGYYTVAGTVATGVGSFQAGTTVAGSNLKSGTMTGNVTASTQSAGLSGTYRSCGFYFTSTSCCGTYSPQTLWVRIS